MGNTYKAGLLGGKRSMPSTLHALIPAALLSTLASLAFATPAKADAAASPPAENWAAHWQFTLVDQGTLAFRSEFRGRNSLDPGARGRETTDLTLYAGVRPWAGAEIWANPEVDQGFGLSNTLGAAGFPSGEAYKVGHNDPYILVHRLFLRQTINLGGEDETIAPDQNSLSGRQTANRVVVTLGKISVGDIFDTNAYAHDPRMDFFNWSVIDAGTFDYAADAWGFSYGGAVEWRQKDWTLRTGLFALSRIPNGEALDSSFKKFQWIGEAEHRYVVGGRPGQIKATAFVNRAPMGAFVDAVKAASASQAPPNLSAVARYRSRSGLNLNLQQQVTDEIGLFARAGVSDGHIQSYEFCDIDRSVSAGVSMSGRRWSRPVDVAGAALVVNDISSAFKTYLARGGVGLTIGDGALPRSGAETVFETYYSYALASAFRVSVDYQVIANPAYNRDRGPVSIIGLRLHGAL